MKWIKTNSHPLQLYELKDGKTTLLELHHPWKNFLSKVRCVSQHGEFTLKTNWMGYIRVFQQDKEIGRFVPEKWHTVQRIRLNGRDFYKKQLFGFSTTTVIWEDDPDHHIARSKQVMKGLNTVLEFDLEQSFQKTQEGMILAGVLFYEALHAGAISFFKFSFGKEKQLLT